MRQLPSDKYNVAWFKLAEFVARGERERALALYTLLAHSFQDRALAHQLKGDILLSFKDLNGACSSYSQAAQLYRDDARTLEAAALYEHLVTIDVQSIDYIKELINLYYLVNMQGRLLPHLNKLCYLLIDLKHFDNLEIVLSEWEAKLERNDLISLYKNVTLDLMRKKVDQKRINAYLEKTVELLVEGENNMLLQPFLASLEALNHVYYAVATKYMQEKSVQL